MRSMLQLVGGVAVAGAVAAGSTAFTAAGVTDSTGAHLKQGGKVAVLIDEGAAVQSITLDQDATNADRINGVHLALNKAGGGDFITATGTVKITMTGNTGNAAVTVACTNSATNVWDCVDSGKYWAGPISEVAVSVWLA
jgi:hypothetical protein